MAGRALRDTYRHGSLRGDAVAAAYALAQAGGLKAVTLRAVAERTGVAHRSLYNHFADRDALVDAVAELAFADLARALRPAQTPADYVRAYVGFALANPGLYEVAASRPHGTMKKHRPSLQAAAHLSIAEARRIFSRPERSSTENRRAIMKVIVLIHGGLAMRDTLDVEGDEGLIAELVAMVDS
jgi:AcrR family transcriptional regulator